MMITAVIGNLQMHCTIFDSLIYILCHIQRVLSVVSAVWSYVLHEVSLKLIR